MIGRQGGHERLADGWPHLRVVCAGHHQDEAAQDRTFMSSPPCVSIQPAQSPSSPRPLPRWSSSTTCATSLSPTFSRSTNRRIASTATNIGRRSRVAGRAMVRMSALPPSRRPALRLPRPACAGSAACWRSGVLAARCPAIPSCGRRHRRTRRGRSPDGKAVLLEIALDPAEELFPDAEAGPADEGLGRHPPRAVMRRNRAPVGVVPMPPEDRVDGPLEIMRLRLAARPAAFEQWHEYGPLRLGQHQIPLAHDSAANHITKGNLLLQSGYPPPVALCRLAATGEGGEIVCVRT